MIDWHWPQWTEATLFALALVIAISKHGESRGEYSGPATFIGLIFSGWLLWCGGFWG